MFYRLRRIRSAFQISTHTEFLYEHALHTLPEVECPAGLHVRLLEKGESHVLQQVWNVNLDQLAKRWDRGDLCYVGFIDTAICSYHWVQYSGTHFFQQAHQQIKVKPNEGWIYHVRVADWAKGRGVNGFVYKRILEDARRSGKVKLFIYTGATNTANQKGLVKCGFNRIKEIFSVLYLRRYYLIREKAIRS